MTICHRTAKVLYFRAPHFEMFPWTLPLQLTRPRHPHGTQEVLLSAAAFLPCSGLQVQGTAISPAARNLSINDFCILVKRGQSII